MLSAEKWASFGWRTPTAVTFAILTLANSGWAGSTLIFSIVSVRVASSNATLPWLALPPLARICSNAASTSAVARCWV
ncbi:hypothetical protein ABIF93_003767 [Bradyrhizobium japonicum]